MAEGKKRLYNRATANAALCNSLCRAVEVNSKTAAYPFPFYVGELAIFGSLITSTGKVHDVDVAIQLKPCKELDEQRKTGKFIDYLIKWEYTYFRERAERSGYVFFLPEEETQRYIKAGKGIISLHQYDELQLLHCPYVPLITNGKLTPDGEAVLNAHGADGLVCAE